MFTDLIRRLMGRVPGFDGMDRRETMRAKVDFELDVACQNLRYLAQVLDASPRGLRMRIRGPWKPNILKKDQEANLKYLVPIVGAEVDTIKSRIRWAKKEAENLFLLAVSFDEPVETLQKSWVKPVLLQALKKKVAQQRKSLRVRCKFPVRFNVEGNYHDGSLHDLSMEGARLEAFFSFSEGTPMVLDIEVEGLPMLKVAGTVKRVLRPYGTYTYGLQLKPDAAGKKLLLSYIRHLQAIQKRKTL